MSCGLSSFSSPEESRQHQYRLALTRALASVRPDPRLSPKKTKRTGKSRKADCEQGPSLNSFRVVFANQDTTYMTCYDVPRGMAEVYPFLRIPDLHLIVDGIQNPEKTIEVIMRFLDLDYQHPDWIRTPNRYEELWEGVDRDDLRRQASELGLKDLVRLISRR